MFVFFIQQLICHAETPLVSLLIGYIIRRTLRISSHLFATNTHFPLYTPSSGNLKCATFDKYGFRFFPAICAEITPEMDAILLVNEALSVLFDTSVPSNKMFIFFNSD